jgi:predicted nucleic acid-binding protein
VTSALVIAEGHGWFLRRYDPRRAIQFLGFIDELAVLKVQAFDAPALSGSARLARKFADRQITLADAHGLMLLEQRRIAACWSTDRHLGLTGVPLVV